MKLHFNSAHAVHHKGIVFLLILFLVHPLTIAQNNNKTANVASATHQLYDSVLVQNLKAHTCFLASDALRGRKPGSEGFARASSYAETIFKNQGLKPLFKKQNVSRPYRQPIAYYAKTYDKSAEMHVQYQNQQSKIPARDIKYFNLMDNQLFQHNYPVVYFHLANLKTDTSFQYQTTPDWKNKILIVSAATKDSTPESVNITLQKVSGIAATDNPPAGIILITNKAFSPIWDRIHNMITSEGYEPAVDVPKRMQLFNTDLMLLKEQTAALFLKELMTSGVSPGSVTPQQPYTFTKTSIYYAVPFTEKKYDSWNLGGYIPGNDPVLADEFIVVGAHLDHLGVVDGKIMNGADDNASGSAALLELVKRLKNVKHKRSIALILWTGEESEAMGSQQFFAHLPIPLDKIKWYVNFDMIGRTAPENSKTGALYVSTSTSCMKEVKEIFKTSGISNLPLIFTTRGLSDHFVFELYHIPNFGFYSGHHADVHQPTDDPQKLNYQQMAEVVSAAQQVIEKLASD